MSDQHEWVMVRTWALEGDQVAAVAADPEGWSAEGPGEVTGPGCRVCHQAYAIAHTLPCPGRIWAVEDDPLKRASRGLPRAERRRRERAKRHAHRGMRTPNDCPHPWDKLQWRGGLWHCSGCDTNLEPIDTTPRVLS